jgi:hypothetical protein
MVRLLSTFAFTLVGIIGFHQQLVYFTTILHNLLPPWDFLSDFPRLQKGYKLLVYVVGYAAGNGRSTFWRSLSTNNGRQPSPINGNGGK